MIHLKEEVLKVLESEYSALDIMSINDLLGLTTVEELQELESTLESLVSNFEVYYTKKKKYILYNKCPNFRKGYIDVKKGGYGFLLLQEEEDIHIKEENLGEALDGDLVLVEILDAIKHEGKVIRVLKRATNHFVGELKMVDGILTFVPKEKKGIDFKINLKGCVEGEIVAVALGDHIGKNLYRGSVIKHICHKDDPGEDILSIAAKYDIYLDYPKEAIEQAENLPTEVLESDWTGRTDLTDKVIFTIDGVHTKDIDDAIGLERKGDDYLLRVSIADVSHYVPYESPLDKEAFTRGTSSYLADTVIPMLPHILSNGICSLNPEVLRCAITCEMQIDHKGMVKDSSIYPSIIKSVKKMNYDAVNQVLDNKGIPEGYEEYANILKEMNELAHIIRRERTNRGASDFDVAEAEIVVDETGKAIDVIKRERGQGEMMIEDFMVIANETVAKTFMMENLPSLYRVHEVPKEEKVQAFIQFCSGTGQQIKGKYKNINPKAFQSLLAQINVDEEKAPLYRAMAVRSMPKAKYSEENIGHFGLASKNYTHFTSPIRRYPDLQIHRLLRTYLFENKKDAKTKNFWEHQNPEIASHASDREVQAVEAEREVTKIKMAEYMESHVGEEFDGMVSGVSAWGMYIQLPNLIEGLIPLDTLNDDHYQFIEELQCLIGKNTKKKYTIGDKLHVRCIAATKEEGFIDFIIADDEEKQHDRNQQ